MESVQTALATFSWPAALAVVASVVAIVTGYFGYLIKTRTPPPAPQSQKSTLPTSDVQQIHSRISELKDRLSTIESDAKVLVHKTNTLEQKITYHESRDEGDFRQLNIKIDKLTDIVLKILSDDRL